MDYYDKYIKYKQKYLSLKDAFVQSDRIKEKYLSLKDIFTQSDRNKQKYLDLKDPNGFVQSDNKINLIGGKRKYKREVSDKLEIKILKQGIPYKNVISVCYFTMKDAYRNVEKYQKNLRLFLYKKNHLKGFETRIYTDDSGKDFALEVSKNDPYVSVYHYNFPPLREEIGHIGTFGTYIRFLPLFEFGLQTVWISDIDIPNYYLNPILISDSKKSGAQFCYRTYLCYENTKYGRSYSIVANTILSFMTFPIEIFNTFLNDLVIQPKQLKKYIEEMNESNKSSKKPYSLIPYGIDELFMNHNIYDYLINNNIKCYILKDYLYVSSYLIHDKLLTKEEDDLFYKYYYNQNDDLVAKILKVFKKKLPFIADKYECVQDMLSNINSFKHSFIKILIKTGQELNENIY